MRQAQLLDSPGFLVRTVACLGNANPYTQRDAVEALAALTRDNERAALRLLREGGVEGLSKCYGACMTAPGELIRCGRD